MNTFLAASAAMLGWLLVERIKDGHATTLGGASGAVAGLVAITPCAGFVGGMAPIYIGFARRRRLLPGARHQEDVQVRRQPRRHRRAPRRRPRRLDPARASSPTTPSTRSSPTRACSSAAAPTCSCDQVVASVVTLVFSFVVTFIIAKVIDMTMGLRVDEADEDEGLDLSQHAETAYAS